MTADLKVLAGFIGGYNTERSIQIDNQRTLNMYVIQDAQSPEQQQLAMLPGLNFIRQTPASISYRTLGLFAFRNDLYQVIDENLYKNQLFVGSISTIVTPIWWTATPLQVVFTDSAKIYVYAPLTGVFTTVANNFLINPGKISCINGRVIVPLLNSNIWYVSALNDGTSFDQNRFALFNLRADALMGSAAINNRLLLVGQFHTESWFPVATVAIPLNIDNNVVIDYGTWASSSIVTSTNDEGPKFVAWLARDELGSPSFIKSEGTSAVRISTQAIEILLQSFQSLSDCYGVSRRIDGHLFVEWSFPTDNYTLVYDANTNIWFERKMLDNTHFIGNSAAYVNGIHYVGSRKDGSLYQMSSDYLTYYTSGQTKENIHRQRISGILRNPKQSKFEVPYLEVKYETGYVPSNIVPYAYLQTSRNGDVFDNARQCPMSQIGQYDFKTYWYGLGANYSLIVKLDMYDPVRTFLIGASVLMGEALR